jgi:hypothetical protein
MSETHFPFAGLPIPTSAPLFVAFLVPHLLAGITCVVFGIVAMVSRKQKGRHSKAGTVYYYGLSVIFITGAGLASMRWGADRYLFILGTLSFALASIGRYTLRQRSPGGIRLHVTGMGFSYVVMLIAFYMDNGPNLPLWRDLPPAAYWLIPLLVGIPFIGYAFLKHPLVRSGYIPPKIIK